MLGYIIFFLIIIFLYKEYKNIKLYFSKDYDKSVDINNIDNTDLYKNLNQDQKFNSIKVNKQKEIDRILEKISKSGFKSLSEIEKNYLDKYSNNIR